MPLRLPAPPVASLLLAATAALLAGCASAPRAADPTLSGATLHGRVMGGLQPVTGAALQLYATGTSGYGSASAPLLVNPVSTDQNGNFDITGDYTCPSSSTQVYLLVSGGNPGLAAGTSNQALRLASPLGACGTLSSATFISVTELSTVAAAYALAPFTTSPTAIGTSPANLRGLANAFALATSLVSITSKSPGLAPAIATVPTPELDTLADILSTCVNSDGSVTPATPCGRLFTATTPVNGTAPTDTLSAALNIARNPARNVTTLFNSVLPTSPWQPTLASAPPDWTVAITYASPALSTPADIAIDSQGTAWVLGAPGTAGSGSSTVNALSFATGLAGTYPQQNLNFANLAIDSADNLWLSDSAHSSIVELTNAGTRVNPAAYTGGGIRGPGPLAFDPAGNLWIVNNSATVSRLSPTGAALSPSSGYATGGSSGPTAIAIDAAGQVYTTDSAGSSVSKLSQAGTLQNGAPFTGSGLSSPFAIAIDAAAQPLVANRTTSTLTRFAATGTPPAATSFSGGGLNTPIALALDGLGTAWAVNAGSSTLAVLTPNGASGSTSTPPGITPAAAGYGSAFLVNPYRLALDASGSVWVINLGTRTPGSGVVTQFIGAAAPVLTPTANAVTNNLLAQRP